MEVFQFVVFCVVTCVVCSAVFDEWTQWSIWSSCSSTCEVGIQRRRRECLTTGIASRSIQRHLLNIPPDDKRIPEEFCDGDSLQTKPCSNTMSCPVNGNWEIWSAWTACSVSCGEGTKTRSRKCNNPPPSNGGLTCAGTTQDTMSCITRLCPAVNGGWSAWTPWATCDVSCGGGMQVRSRTCNNPSPLNCGTFCSGYQRESRICNRQCCPVNGNWETWLTWSTCTVSCGGGTRIRLRNCNNPTPTNSGLTCPGKTYDLVSCQTQTCPVVNGGWSGWSTWTTCSVSCGSSIQHKTRSCNNPSPKDGGASCTGHNIDSRLCSTQLCPVNGNWETWLTWSTCTVSCGGGTRIRLRNCNNPTPTNSGITCPGKTYDVVSCQTQTCPVVNGGWSGWSTWTTCSVSCGSSIQHKTRSCNNPSPKDGGASCTGHNIDSRLCSTQLCPVLAAQQRSIQELQSEPLLKGIIGGLAIILVVTIVVVLILFRKYKESPNSRRDESFVRKTIKSNFTQPLDNEYEEIRENKEKAGQKENKKKPTSCENYEMMLVQKCNQVYEQLSVTDIRDNGYVNMMKS